MAVSVKPIPMPGSERAARAKLLREKAIAMQTNADQVAQVLRDTADRIHPESIQKVVNPMSAVADSISGLLKIVEASEQAAVHVNEVLTATSKQLADVETQVVDLKNKVAFLTEQAKAGVLDAADIEALARASAKLQSSQGK